MNRSRPLPLTLALAATAVATVGGCGLPRHLALRPDHDLPAGFSGTYRRSLVLAGEVPPGPTDRDAFARLAAAAAGPVVPPEAIRPVVPGPLPAPTVAPRPLPDPPPPDIAVPLFADPPPADRDGPVV